MSILKANFLGDPNIGLYGFATEKYAVSGVKNKNLEKALGVPSHRVSLYGTYLSGIFAAGNSKGIIVSDLLSKSEIKKLKSAAKVLVLKTSYTAIGNLVLMNDKGIVLSPLLRRFRKDIEAFFSLPVAVSTVAGISVVGSVAVATNGGCLAHPHATQKEKNTIKKTLGVPVTIGTVSFGSPFVKSGVLANHKGAVVSDKCSGIEIGNIHEAFDF